MATELAQRENDGIVVTLFWHEATDTLTVSVRDARAHEGFVLEVEPGDAMDVFNHPYAYAARRPRRAPVAQAAARARCQTPRLVKG